MRLPQCEIFYPNVAQEILFALGGRAPGREFFLSATVGRKIICVDKGLELCRACEIVPDFLIGDFDSASPDAVTWAQTKNIPLERHPADKDLTDTQLALNRAAELFGEHNALLTGCFGGRADHLYSTLFTCAALSGRSVLADEREIVLYVRGGESVRVKFFVKPFAMSLLPMTQTCAGVETENLHWELGGATLTQAFPNAVSNRVESYTISVGLRSGTLAVYLCFAE